jgi:hypothetical protein
MSSFLEVSAWSGLPFLVPTVMFADVVGNLEGETTVEESVRASPPFTYRSEPSRRHQLEEFESWGDIFRRLRGSLLETSLSRVRIGIKHA